MSSDDAYRLVQFGLACLVAAWFYAHRRLAIFVRHGSLLLCGKFRRKVFHAPVAFDRIAVAAQKLKVVQVVGPALRSGDHVVDRQVPRLEMRFAPVAVTALPAT